MAPPKHLRRRPPRSWPRRLLIGLNIFIGFCLVATASGYLYLRWRFGQIETINIACEVLRNCGDDDPAEPMNVLLVGSDTRAVIEDPEEQRRFGTQEMVGAEHSDTMMILHADPNAERAAILSVPRDLYVTIADTGRRDRINTAIQSGPENLIRTIRQELGIEIDHYIQVDFNGFRGIVDAVGGVTIPFPSPARDPMSNLRVPEAGCVKLDGEQALAFARSRHYQYYESGRWRTDPSGDLGRITRQQIFIQRLMKEAIRAGIRNPVRADRLISAGIKNVVIDDALSSSDMVRLFREFRSLEPEAVEMLAVPTSDFRTDAGAAVLRIKQPEADEVIARFKGIRAGEEAPSGPLPAVIPGTRVRVLNGSGVGGQATEVSRSLQEAGFTVTGFGDADKFTYVQPTITYGPGQRERALVLRAYVDGAARLVENRRQLGQEIVLTTGSAFGGIRTEDPTPTSTTATTAGATAEPRGATEALAC